DQFWTTRTGVAVLRPAELCAPTRTTGAGLTPSPVPNARDQLVCYPVALRSSFPGADVFVTNKLDSQRASKLPSGGGSADLPPGAAPSRRLDRLHACRGARRMVGRTTARLISVRGGDSSVGRAPGC